MREPAHRPYGSAMSDEDDKPNWFLARLHIIIGVVGLIAWLVMLWLMFGDVL